MPFKSQAQRGLMYSQHPELAKEMESKTPAGKKLPYHVKKSKKAAQLAAMKKMMAKKK